MKTKNQQQQQLQQQQQQCDGDPLDRLLFIHSDISSLLRQIDELVVQAVNVNITDDKEREEIKSFTEVLSETHSSLKPWVPRLQKLLGVPDTDLDAPLDENSVGVATVHEDEEQEVDTPETIKQDSLVSPSPLVSWRATDCTVEGGKQLFLLTPLPKSKASSLRLLASAKPTTSKVISSHTAAKVPSLGDNGKSNQAKPQAGTKNVKSTSELEFVSPLKMPFGEFSTNLMTPCLKASPPRSCVLQEPSRQFYRKIDQSHKSTPFPVRNNNCESTDSESSSGEISEKLGLKYPELIGIKPSRTINNASRMLEASPAWMRSPPKFCTLLELRDEKPVKHNAPSDGCLQDLASKFNQQVYLAPKESTIQADSQDILASKIAVVECTPMWKGCESTIKRGKRPGENTLKKELWTRFEAATTDGIRLNLSNYQDTSQKGFLDRLEEATCDEASPHPNSVR